MKQEKNINCRFVRTEQYNECESAFNYELMAFLNETKESFFVYILT